MILPFLVARVGKSGSVVSTNTTRVREYMRAALTEDLDKDVVVDDFDADVAVQSCSNQATYRSWSQYNLVK